MVTESGGKSDGCQDLETRRMVVPGFGYLFSLGAGIAGHEG